MRSSEKILAKMAIVLIVLLAFTESAQAQCAMCKAVAESSRDGGSGIADGLNHGILYLMVFPYLLMGVVGYALWRSKRRKKSTSAL